MSEGRVLRMCLCIYATMRVYMPCLHSCMLVCKGFREGRVCEVGSCLCLVVGLSLSICLCEDGGMEGSFNKLNE